MGRSSLIAGLCLLLAACGPAPTPLPVIPVTATVSLPTIPSIIEPPAVTYRLDTLAALILGTRVDTLRRSADIVLSDQPSVPSTVAIVLNPAEGALPFPTTTPYAIVLNPSALPATQSEATTGIRLAIVQMSDASANTTSQDVRIALANAGFPDGIRIAVGPLPPDVLARLEELGIEAVPSGDELPVLRIEKSPREMADSADVFEGFSAQLYIIAEQRISITFGEDGLPRVQIP